MTYLETSHSAAGRADDAVTDRDPWAALAPFKAIEWRRLSPRERLRRSWRMRSSLVDLRAVHDRKLFPAP
jgi:hypothetical protein